MSEFYILRYCEVLNRLINTLPAWFYIVGERLFDVICFLGIEEKLESGLVNIYLNNKAIS